MCMKRIPGYRDKFPATGRHLEKLPEKNLVLIQKQIS